MEARLEIDLGALADNYRMLRKRCPEECGATVKADAYGLSVQSVVRELIDVGCKNYFVATLSEGIALRTCFHDINIYVFSGLGNDDEELYKEHNLQPVLNTINQLVRWGTSGPNKGAAFHIDTGMNRLGVCPEDLLNISEMQGLLRSAGIEYLMTHLSCADTPSHEENSRQLKKFRDFADHFPEIKTSIGNSAGVMNGAEFCGNLARPGIALYGGNPWSSKANPTESVVRLTAPILQARFVKAGNTVGYGATHKILDNTVLATVGVGYADGIPRSLSCEAFVVYNDKPRPIVGRISMDTIIIDLLSTQRPGEVERQSVELIGHTSIDTFAKWSDTTSYELLTGIGRRIDRCFI